jgi:ribosomal protein S11
MKEKLRFNRRRQIKRRNGGKLLVKSSRNNTKVVRTWYDVGSGKVRSVGKTAGSTGFPNSKRATLYAGEETRKATILRFLKRYNERNPEYALKLQKKRKVKGPRLPRKRWKKIRWKMKREKHPQGIHVFRQGKGKLRRRVMKILRRSKRKILTRSDASKDAHNGCKGKKRRRL